MTDFPAHQKVKSGYEWPYMRSALKRLRANLALVFLEIAMRLDFKEVIETVVEALVEAKKEPNAPTDVDAS